MREKGFTLLELLMGGAILASVLGVTAAALARDQQTQRVLTAQLGPEMAARNAVERIATELRMAGEWAEDRDQDGELDPGEDSNGNGVLDAAWNLADGVTGQPQLSFNRRMDLRGSGGEILASGIYSRRVSYWVDGTDLVREWERPGPAGTVIVRRAVIAHDVSGLRFSRSGVVVTVAVDVSLPPEIYQPAKRTFTARIWLRN